MSQREEFQKSGIKGKRTPNKVNSNSFRPEPHWMKHQRQCKSTSLNFPLHVLLAEKRPATYNKCLHIITRAFFFPLKTFYLGFLSRMRRNESEFFKRNHRQHGNRPKEKAIVFHKWSRKVLLERKLCKFVPKLLPLIYLSKSFFRSFSP